MSVKTLRDDVKVKQFHFPVKPNHDGYIQQQFTKIKTNLENILYKRKLTASYQELYNTVEDICLLNREEELFEDLIIIITEFLNIKLINLINFEQAHFLDKLNDFWKFYCETALVLKNMYLYFEWFVTKKEKRKFSLWNVFMEKFFNIIVSNEVVKKKLAYVIKLIEFEREEEKVDTRIMKEIIGMLDTLHVYREFVEEDFLAETGAFYKKKREEVLDGDVVEYFYYVQNKILQEDKRVDLYLKRQTKDEVLKLLYSVLLEEKLIVLMNKLEVADIFDKFELHDIITIYNLLIVVPKANNQLCKIFNNYLLRKGDAFMSNPNEKNMISELLDFKDRVNEIVSTCFNNSNTYEESVRTCFKKFVNDKKYKPASSLVKYIDSKMRDKLIPEELLDKILVLFRYIQGKDVFEAFYKRYLAKRLLLGKSSSIDAEKYMITKLKLECGDVFTSKLEGMFRDIDLSESLNSSFKQKTPKINSIDFNVNVLTSSSWPSFPKYKVTLPEMFLKHQEAFQEFYKSKHSGRTLQWNCGLGSCLIRAYLKNGNKDFQVSLYQALILLLFNKNKNMSYSFIRNNLNLDNNELKRTLASLVFGKIKILIKNPDCFEIGNEDTFEIDEDFKSKLFRIKINQIQYKETEEEQKITEEEVKRDRNLEIDAALVRLMKLHKKLRHNELVAKIFEMLKISVSPNDIKKRIETLIEREFLTRDTEDANLYHYIA